MANVSNTKSSRKPVQQRSAARSSDIQELSGERDPLYDLVSVLYHGLQGADQCAIFAEDADQAGDTKLAAFLREAGQAQGQLAKRAKQLLVDRLPDRSDQGRSQTGGGSSRLGDSGEAEEPFDSNARDDD